MKLVSLNVWGGTVYEPLMAFLAQNSVDTDIFCFQEVFSSGPGAPEVSSGARMYLLDELTKLLPGHTGFFEPRSEGLDFNGPINAPVRHGLAVFAAKTVPVKSVYSKTIAITDEPIDRLVKAQILELGTNPLLSVMNFHGIAMPGEKLDTPERLKQSQSLAELWQALPSEKILCGDFNLMPETESVKILQTCGRDLIRDFNIKNTRNRISWERFNNLQYFADYCFVSDGVKVSDFHLPDNEVSDHLPMVLEFDLKPGKS